ncbi:hypothetical protein PsYK624_061730 [Phanerochaete sordida]|uniref:Uncharacterized protein n=1 Tax=Phanerochaete sordida TaxID=48140 RepID=A0A9P3G8U9_9APHY|nr:hypothetical protein PsYK624_061730 [Phanerochaete sordida]
MATEFSDVDGLAENLAICAKTIQPQLSCLDRRSSLSGFDDELLTELAVHSGFSSLTIWYLLSRIDTTGPAYLGPFSHHPRIVKRHLVPNDGALSSTEPVSSEAGVYMFRSIGHYVMCTLGPSQDEWRASKRVVRSDSITMGYILAACFREAVYVHARRLTIQDHRLSSCLSDLIDIQMRNMMQALQRVVFYWEEETPQLRVCRKRCVDTLVEVFNYLSEPAQKEAYDQLFPQLRAHIFATFRDNTPYRIRYDPRADENATIKCHPLQFEERPFYESVMQDWAAETIAMMMNIPITPNDTSPSDHYLHSALVCAAISNIDRLSTKQAEAVLRQATKSLASASLAAAEEIETCKEALANAAITSANAATKAKAQVSSGAAQANADAAQASADAAKANNVSAAANMSAHAEDLATRKAQAVMNNAQAVLKSAVAVLKDQLAVLEYAQATPEMRAQAVLRSSLITLDATLMESLASPLSCSPKDGWAAFMDALKGALDAVDAAFQAADVSFLVTATSIQATLWSMKAAFASTLTARADAIAAQASLEAVHITFAPFNSNFKDASAKAQGAKNAAQGAKELVKLADEVTSRDGDAVKAMRARSEYIASKEAKAYAVAWTANQTEALINARLDRREAVVTERAVLYAKTAHVSANASMKASMASANAAQANARAAVWNANAAEGNAKAAEANPTTFNAIAHDLATDVLQIAQVHAKAMRDEANAKAGVGNAKAWKASTDAVKTSAERAAAHASAMAAYAEVARANVEAKATPGNREAALGAREIAAAAAANAVVAEASAKAAAAAIHPNLASRWSWDKALNDVRTEWTNRLVAFPDNGGTPPWIVASKRCPAELLDVLKMCCVGTGCTEADLLDLMRLRKEEAYKEARCTLSQDKAKAARNAESWRHLLLWVGVRWLFEFGPRHLNDTGINPYGAFMIDKMLDGYQSDPCISFSYDEGLLPDVPLSLLAWVRTFAPAHASQLQSIFKRGA